MNRRIVKDVSASVRSRLLEHSRASNRPFQEVLQYFAMERFLYRLSKSKHSKNFILKGGLMLAAWQAPETRPTKDMDFLAKITCDPQSIKSIIADICSTEVDPDGLIFDPATLEASVIKEDADYEGIRVIFRGSLQNARIHMQIDIGFGDVIVPAPVKIAYPTVLDHQSPQINGYPRETTVAEKFEAMVKLGQYNSRIRDFFDVWMLSRQFEFEGSVLQTAIQKTFSNRQTPIEESPVAFEEAFTTNPAKQSQWSSFCKKSRIDFAPLQLTEIAETLAQFLSPVARSILEKQGFSKSWRIPGGWQD